MSTSRSDLKDENISNPSTSPKKIDPRNNYDSEDNQPSSTVTHGKDAHSSLASKYHYGNKGDLIKDCAAVVLVGILLLIVHYTVSPFQRGFFCDDESIRYPHHESTVSSGLCYALGTGINLALILFIEYRETLKLCPIYVSPTDDRFPIKIYIHRVYHRTLVWLFGALTSELFTDISKVTAGRLRPHFIDVCKPQVSFESNFTPLDEYCSTTTSRYKYITDYKCTSGPKGLRDIRLSFMSGHSSYSAYSAIHAVLYIQSRLDIETYGFFKSAAQLVLTLSAFFVGLTRVSDYKHHWQDVLAGLIQGTLVATLISLYVWPAYEKTHNGEITKKSRKKLTVVGDQAQELQEVAF